ALYTGVFGVGDGGPFVLHRDEFQPADAKEALQCGPLLLHRGAPVEIAAGLGRIARRAVIGIDKQGQMIVAVTDAVIGGLSFAELQELFANPRWQLETPELLNLDGGGSAQLYVKAGKFEDWLPGTTEVPVASGSLPNRNEEEILTAETQRTQRRQIRSRGRFVGATGGRPFFWWMISKHPGCRGQFDQKKDFSPRSK